MTEDGSGHQRTGKRSRRCQGGSVAFSTGQAARFCFVTADSILNWIHNGSLRAQRTPGGQYRILAPDLIAFMRQHGMSAAQIEADLGIDPYCWEFHARGEIDEPCLSCVVHRSRAINCYELRHLMDPRARKVVDCNRCEYYARHADSGERNA